MQSDQSPGLGLHVQLVLFAELLAEVVDQDFIQSLPSELRVKRCGEDLKVENILEQVPTNIRV